MVLLICFRPKRTVISGVLAPDSLSLSLLFLLLPSLFLLHPEHPDPTLSLHPVAPLLLSSFSVSPTLLCLLLSLHIDLPLSLIALSPPLSYVPVPRP